MRPASRRPFVAVFAAYFGCIALVGQGLHYVVGHTHHGGIHAESHCAAHDHQADHRTPCAAGAAHQHDEHAGLALLPAPAHDEHDCPICSYFAQAQVPVDCRPVGLELVSSPMRSAAEQVEWLARVGVYNSRAPPAGLLIS